MRTVAGYSVEAELGRGGMGRVLRVRHLATGVERALKVMEGVSGPEALARFRREAEALARAAGAGVPIHETGLEQGAFWYVMDLMAGGSLRDRLAARGRLPWREACALVARIARLVERCHALGLVHRDLKPENVLFDDSDLPRLADFGCVRDAGAGSLTEAGELLGTLAYMAPEQLNGQKVDGRTDVFALGVILHELIAGERPFQGQSWSELLIAIGESTRPALTAIPDVPAKVEEIARRATAVAVADRFQRASELAGALLAVTGDDAATALAAEGRATKDARSGEGTSWRLVVLLLLLAAGAATGGGSLAAWSARRKKTGSDGAVLDGRGPVATASAPGEPRAEHPRPKEAAIEDARRRLSALAEGITVEQLIGHVSLMTPAREVATGLGKVTALEDAELAPLLEPCTAALRSVVFAGIRENRTEAIFGGALRVAFAPLCVGERDRRPPTLRLATELMESPAREASRETSEPHAARLESLALAVGAKDPLLAAVGFWVATDWIAKTLGDGTHALADWKAARVLELDSRAEPLFAASGKDEPASASSHLRHRLELMRDTHFDLALTGPESDRAGHAERAVAFAIQASACPGAEGGTLAQGLKVLVDRVPTDARTAEYVGRYRGHFKKHALYCDWLLQNEGPDAALAQIAKAHEPGEALPDKHDLAAVEALARGQLGDAEGAARALAEVKRVEGLIPWWGVIFRYSSGAVEAKLATLKKE